MQSISRKIMTAHRIKAALSKRYPGAAGFFESVSHRAHSKAASAMNVETDRSGSPQPLRIAKGQTAGRKAGISPRLIKPNPVSANRAKAMRIQPGTAIASRAGFASARLTFAAMKVPRAKPTQPPVKDISSGRREKTVSPSRLPPLKIRFGTRKKNLAPTTARIVPKTTESGAHSSFRPAFFREKA